MGYFRFEKMGTIAAVSTLLLGLMGCIQAVSRGQADAQPKPTPVQERPAMQKPGNVNPKLVAANSQFGFKLFGEILKQDQGKNVFVSPASVAIALAMTYNGASGDTQKEMEKVLQLNGMSLSELNRANADLKTLLENPDPKVQLTISNSLWARQDVRFKTSFMQRNRWFYGAEITNLNFNAPNAPARINGWVKDNTRGKIDRIVDNIDPDAILFLINAIYFKGDWNRPFDPQNTTNKPFYRADGTQKQHPMMSQRGPFRYRETEKFQAIRLFYGKEGRISMYILLPKPSYSLADFSKDLTAASWGQWFTPMGLQEGSLELPRFKQEYNIELKRVLSALGMASAFNPSKSDFSGITDRQVWIDQVKHKTFVEVNEKGTEAAAVTSVGARTTSVIVDEPFKMVVDRPFFCAIRDDRTRSVLFIGAIVDPQ